MKRNYMKWRDVKCDIRGCDLPAVGEAKIRRKWRPVCDHHADVYFSTSELWEDPRSVYEKERPGMTGKQWDRRRKKLKRQGIDPFAKPENDIKQLSNMVPISTSTINEGKEES